MNHQILTAITRARSMSLKALALYGAEEIPGVLHSEQVSDCVWEVAREKSVGIDGPQLMGLYELSLSRLWSLLEYESTVAEPADGTQESDWVERMSRLLWKAWEVKP